MAIQFQKKKFKQKNVLYTILTAILLSLVFLAMVVYFYAKTEAEAYENLHVQTKQIKDDLILQLTSDRENLATMANFAAKLYADGEDYSIMFESFKPIGMIENIGILNADDTFATKAGVADVHGLLSFAEEKEKGVYISGRIEDITNQGYELIRSAVPIEVNGEVVGILYGAIKPDKLGARYKGIVQELDAQLFVYEKGTGDILIDTIQEELGNISAFENRKYNEGYSYDQLVHTDKGFVAFHSTIKNETLHLHYSTIEAFGWVIAFGRYDSQVFAGTHNMTRVMLIIYLVMIAIIALYIIILMAGERRISAVTECASNARKELLETMDGQNNIQDALKEITDFAKARSAIFFDTNGEFYHYIAPRYEEAMLLGDEQIHFKSELFDYAKELYKHNGQPVNIFDIKPNVHMQKTNAAFAEFLNAHGIDGISMAAAVSKANHVTVLAIINPKIGVRAGMLVEKVSACFSMAMYNKNFLNKTLTTATTDALTGADNRVAYNNDLLALEEERPERLACVYIDVNGLHICNNRHGHAAGDAMLICIANTLKQVFFGHKVYRMGGDEFLVLCKNAEQETIEQCIENVHKELKTRGYHVSAGMACRMQYTEIEDMVREAEVRMYEEKTRYYQEKEQQPKQPSTVESEAEAYVRTETGIREIDAMLSVLQENYNGIYRVSFSTDKAKRILMPAYLKYDENEDHFLDLVGKYVAESVEPDYHRAVTSFMNYDALKKQLSNGLIPRITYKKLDGGVVTLSVYKLCAADEIIDDTLWVFAKA